MLIIGLMSGTSADGVDVALCRITQQAQRLSAEIIAGTTVAYDRTLRQSILDNCQPRNSQIDQIAQLHVDLADEFVRAIKALVDASDYQLSDIDLIGSHGQTLWHNVLPDGRVTVSFQIGEAAILAEKTGITAISNFRARDVAAGGQGAPLTAYVDYLLLRHETKWRAIQNIGGMANVTFLPPLSDDRSQPIAFDTGPGNALIDAAVTYFTDNQQRYDADGQMAAQGNINADWLDELLRHPYYKHPYPKTTGRELFGTDTAHGYIAEAEKRGLSQNDIIATLTGLTATSIIYNYRKFAPAPIGEIIIGGGGKHNATLISMIRSLASQVPVLSHEDIGMNSDFKEALVFAVLAHETWYGRTGTLPSLTGASHATILGNITPAANYEHLLRARIESVFS